MTGATKGPEVLRLLIVGKPQPQGSTTAFVLWKSREGRDKWKWVPLRRPDGSIAVNVTSDNDELKAWRAYVSDSAAAALAATPPAVVTPAHGVGFTVEMTSYLKRREADWRTNGALKDTADAFPIVRPDVDKLLRAALDSLTGHVWDDDSQVTKATTEKRYALPGADGDGIHAEIVVWANAEQTAEDLPEDERQRYVPPPPGQEVLELA